MKRAFLLPALAALALISGSGPGLPRDFDAPLSASPITAFRVNSTETRFGPLTFVGGFSLTSSQSHFGAVSAFRFVEPGGRFLAVTDNGFWLSGTVTRDKAGLPTGIRDGHMSEIEGTDGRPLGNKYEADAESLTVRSNVATVGFERFHRMVEYPLSADGQPGRAGRNLDIVVPVQELRANRGFECLAYSPPDSPLAGVRVAVTEKSLDRKGNIFGAILEGPKRGIFTVAKSGPFDITDCAFLPGGDLVVLERRYSIATGVGMQLRRIAGSDIAPGRLVDGKVLFSGGMDYQIDNMEGMDIWRAADGSLRLSMVSDDNKSLLQRSLYLEFRIEE